MNIENLKKIIALPIELGNIGDSIGQDNKNNWKKWFKLIDALDEVIGLFTVNWKEVKFELEDLTSEEREELIKYMKEKFDVHNDQLEITIERSIDVLMSLGEIVKECLDIYKELKIPK